MSDFKDKVVVVTGGGLGIGRAICRGFAAAGAKVICADINDEVGKALEQETPGPGEIRYQNADVATNEGCQAVVAAAGTEGLDVLCNNVGIAPLSTYVPVHELPIEDWDRIMDVNLKSYFLMSRLCIPEILKRFAQTHPHVDIDVNLGPTRTLRQAIHKGDLDIAVFSFDAELDRQPPIHAEPLVWLGARHGSAIDKRPLPVSMAEPGCYWRTMALKALDDAGVNYRIAYTSEFCQAQIAAVRADLAIAPLPISVISDDLVHLGPSHGLPEIGEYRMTLAKRDGHGAVEEALAEHVIAGFRKISERGMRVFA